MEPWTGRCTQAVLALPCAVIALGCSDAKTTPKAANPSFAVPAPLRPWNGEMTGSAHATSPLRPRFQWKAVAASTSYELQVDDSCPITGFAACTFLSPEIDVRGLKSTSYTPGRNLVVSGTQPMGRRYFWRVRACDAVACSPWSSIRYVDVGRMSQDLNGDGYADVVVGADARGVGQGRLLVYFGGTGGLAPSADLTLTSPQVNDGFAYAAAPAGDLNADGYPDLLVGAYVDGAGGAHAGRTYIYLGGQSLTTTPGLTLTGKAGDYFGIAVSSAGDVNGDGYADFLVGAPGVGSGRAEIYFGGATLDDAPDVTLAGQANGDFFGYPLAPLQDINGDGFGDLLVTAASNDTAGMDAGRAYVYFGGTTMDATADLTLDGEAAGDAYGSFLAGGEDVDGDGYADFAIGASTNDVGGRDAGRVYFYRGAETPDMVADFSVTGSVPNAHVGPVALADLDGDGQGDLVVASSPVNGYRTFVYHGGTTLPTVPGLSIAGNDEVGSMAAAGDVNGDGYGDLVVAAPSNGTAGQPGSVYLYRGASIPGAAAATKLTGATANDNFGICVASITSSAPHKRRRAAPPPHPADPAPPSGERRKGSPESSGAG
jgi:hypothetical protein